MTTCEWPAKILTTPSWSLSCTVLTVQFWCWNSPWCWRYKRFCLAVVTIAGSLSPTSGGSTVLRKGIRRFWPHGRDRCRSLTLTCQNSPCWLSCECCNNVCLPFGRHCSRLTERGCNVACALIGTNLACATASRSRRFNGYQECGCHSQIITNKKTPSPQEGPTKVQIKSSWSLSCSFVAEIHLGSGVVSAFVFPSAAIARALSSTFKVSLPQRLWPPSELQAVASRLPGVRLPLDDVKIQCELIAHFRQLVKLMICILAINLQLCLS